MPMDWTTGGAAVYVFLIAMVFLVAAVGVAVWTVRWLRRPVEIFVSNEPEQKPRGETEEHRFELEDIENTPPRV